jgi:hypothetical protein
MEADEDGDGKLSFDEFARTVANTVRYYVLLFFLVLGYLDKGSCPCQDILARIVLSVYFPTPLYVYHRRFTYTNSFLRIL